jgi:hypothetical protein
MGNNADIAVGDDLLAIQSLARMHDERYRSHVHDSRHDKADAEIDDAGHSEPLYKPTDGEAGECG